MDAATVKELAGETAYTKSMAGIDGSMDRTIWDAPQEMSGLAATKITVVVLSPEESGFVDQLHNARDTPDNTATRCLPFRPEASASQITTLNRPISSLELEEAAKTAEELVGEMKFTKFCTNLKTPSLKS